MNRIKLFTTLSILLILSIVLTSCQPKDLEFRTYKNLKLENLGFNNAQLRVNLVYYNPNNIGLELASTDFDIFVDSSLLGHSNQNVQVTVPARQEFTLPLLVNVDMKNLLKNSLNSFFSKEIEVRLLGNVKVGKLGIYKSIPVDFTTKQNFSFFR